MRTGTGRSVVLIESQPGNQYCGDENQNLHGGGHGGSITSGVLPQRAHSLHIPSNWLHCSDARDNVEYHFCMDRATKAQRLVPPWLWIALLWLGVGLFDA